jgi:peptide/nickel transport system permease protein/oligopeptide transport system permease protein
MSDATASKEATAGLVPDVAPSRTLAADAWRSLRRRPEVVMATVIVAFFAIMAAFPTLFTKTDPRQCLIREARLHPQGFGAEHPFGTDSHGCDLLAQLVHGARPSLLLAFVVVAASVLIGVAVGLIAGYYLGWVDAVASRTIEVFLVIPLLLAALLLLSLFRNVDLGAGTFDAILLPAVVLTMFEWMKYARYVRASTLEAKNLDYVTAARALGASDLRIMGRHVLPNAIGPVTALVPTAIAGIISYEAVLAFLGIGVRPPAISWGIMISSGSEWVLGGSAYLLLFPLACLIATVLALVVLGDALRDALDPRLR